MLKKVRISLITLFVAVFAVCVSALAISSASIKPVFAADSDATFVAGESACFEMVDAVKLRTDAEGFAFKAKMDAATYEGIKADANKEIYFIIIPETKISLIPDAHYYRAIARFTEDGEGHNRGDYDVANSICVYVEAGDYYDADENCYYLQAGVTKLTDNNQEALNYYAIAVIEEKVYADATFTGFSYTYATFTSELPETNLYNTVTAALYDESDYVSVIDSVYNWYGTEDFPILVDNDDDYEALTAKYSSHEAYLTGKYYYIDGGVTTDNTNYPLGENAITTYTVTIASDGTGYGGVSANTIKRVPSGAAISVEGETITINGTEITAAPIDATVQYTYSLSSWNVGGSDLPATVTSDLTITADFARTTNQYTVTWKDGFGNTFEPTGTACGLVDYGTAITEPTASAEYFKGDLIYWQQGNTEYTFPGEVTGDITLTPKQSVANTASNALVSRNTISGDFRAEFFIGKDELDFDYGSTAKEYFGAQIRFYDASSNSASFQLLRWADRIQFKYYNGSSGTGINIIRLLSDSTTLTPSFNMVEYSYSSVIKASLAEKHGITMAVERKGSAWDMYIKVGDVYYIIATNITLDALGSNDITNVQLQSGNASDTNKAYVKGFMVDSDPSAIKKLGYKDCYDNVKNGGSAVVIASNLGSDFRLETMIGQKTLNLSYNESTNAELIKVQLTFKYDSGNTQVWLYRYGNRIIVRNGANSATKNLFTITSDGYGQHLSAHFTDDTRDILVGEVTTNNGITVVVERKNSSWTIYVKVDDNYYLVGTYTLNVSDITSLELYGSAGTTSDNYSFAKDTVITYSPTDTITPVE